MRRSKLSAHREGPKSDKDKTYAGTLRVLNEKTAVAKIQTGGEKLHTLCTLNCIMLRLYLSALSESRPLSRLAAQILIVGIGTFSSLLVMEQPEVD